LYFKNKSARDASTFTGFCGYHDREIFLHLDRKDFDGSQELTTLSAYRTLCREIFMKKSHIRTVGIGKTLDRGRSIEEQFLIQEATSATFEGAESALKELIDIKLQFEAALKTSDYQAFAYCNFRFPGTPDLEAKRALTILGHDGCYASDYVRTKREVNELNARFTRRHLILSCVARIPGSTGLRQIEVELRQRSGVVGPFRCVQDFNADNAAFIVVIDDDAVRDLRAVLDRAIGQVDVNGICFPIHSHAHGLVLSK
jgi:hypothetical protein